MLDLDGTTTSRAALLTPRGRGAIASIRLCGSSRLLDFPERPLFRAADARALADRPLGRIVFGRWGLEPGEEVVVCRRGDELVEIHCHGGDAAARRILRDLERAGCHIVSWQELEADSSGRIVLECREALSHAPTLRTANILLDQCGGALERAIEEVRHSLRKGGSAGKTAQRIDALLAWDDFGRHLTEPWAVVIVGRPNVGKSSLLNALVGYQRAIVFDQPGTTRDLVTAETAIDGWPVRLVDTAGIRAAQCTLESEGIILARDSAATADCRLIVLDGSQPLQPEDRDLLAAWPESLVVANKSDLPRVWEESFADVLPVSSLTGEGLEPLIAAIVGQLVPLTPEAGTAIPMTRRQAELLRRARQALSDGDLSVFESALAEM